MEPISMITAGLGIVKGIKAIIPFFGDKGQKVAEAIDTVEDAIADVNGGKLPPEAKLELAKATMSRDVQMAAQEVQKIQMVYDDQAGGREIIKTALLSDDPLVRQARPKMMILIGKSCIAFAFYAPLSVIAAGQIGVIASIMTEYMSMLRWIGGFMFSAFMTSFTGYTVARYGDKRIAAGSGPGKLLSMAASLGRKIA